MASTVMKMAPMVAALLVALVVSACGGGGTSAPSASPPHQSAPVISWFTATPSSITSGASSTLSWIVTDATSLSIDQGVGSVTGTTSKSVTPTATTTYTLTATTSAGSTTAGLTVVVVPPDPGAAKDLTVQGIDSNSNGIRDDVERYIAFNHSAPAEIAALNQVAKALQAATIATNVQGAAQAERSGIDAIVCLGDVSGGSRAQTLMETLWSEQVNTPDRITARAQSADLIGGQILDVVPGSTGSTCSSVVATVAAQRAARRYASSAPAAEPGYTIISINGIFTDPDNAKLNWLVLMDAVGWSYRGLPIRLKMAYNPTASAGDLLECINQKLSEFPGASFVALANIYLRLSVPTPIYQLYPDLPNKVAVQLGAIFQGKSSYSDQSLQNIKTIVQAAVASGEQVLLVPHSQGNFYANSAYEGIAGVGDGSLVRSLGVMGVASPAVKVAGGGDYVTSTNDRVINAVRFLDSAVLGGNVAIDTTLIETGHDLRTTYLNPFLQGQAEVVRKIHLALDRLAVVQPVASVTVSLISPMIQVGQTTTAAATLKDASGSVLAGRTVAWSSTNTGVATVSSGGLVTAVAAGTASITATSEGKSGSAPVTVRSTPSPPVISSFTATPLTVTAGGSSTLAWSVTGATSLSIDQGIGVVTGTQRIVSPTTTTTYVLTATNSAGSTIREATVTVTSSGGGTLAFHSNRSGTYQIYAMNPDGTGLVRMTSNAFNDIQPVWSPDGRKLAFASDRGGRYAVYTMSLDGLAATQLTNSSGSDSQPAWSPDGSRIAFTSTRDGAEEIYSMGADGSGQTRLTSAWASHKGDPSWSPDGTRLSFSSWQSGSSEIWVMDVNGTNQSMLTRCTTWSGSARWSPDGTRIGFASYGYAWIMNSDGTGARNLTGSCQLCACAQTTQYDDFGSWSPDGTRVALQSRRDGNSEIYVMGADGTGLARITSDAADDSRPSWTSASSSPPPPLVYSFTASPASIVAGESSTLAWVVYGGTSLSLDQGIGPVTGSNMTVRPAAMTNYTLTASNAGGSATQGVTVVVATATADFTLVLDPDPPSAIRSWTARVLTTQVGGPGVVSLVVSVSPAGQGVTATLSPTSVQAGGTAALDVVAGGSAPAGRYVVTVTGAEGSTTHGAAMTVDVTP
jgi:Tol biopolymer transport system component